MIVKVIGRAMLPQGLREPRAVALPGVVVRTFPLRRHSYGHAWSRSSTISAIASASASGSRSGDNPPLDAVAHDGAAVGCDDDWNTARECLELNHAKTFRQGRQDEHVRRGELLVDVVAGHAAEKEQVSTERLLRDTTHYVACHAKLVAVAAPDQSLDLPLRK